MKHATADCKNLQSKRGPGQVQNFLWKAQLRRVGVAALAQAHSTAVESRSISYSALVTCEPRQVTVALPHTFLTVIIISFFFPQVQWPFLRND